MNQTENQESKENIESSKLPQSVEELKESIGSCQAIDEKIKLAIEFMESSISQKGSPQFKLFWESRKVCLDLLKNEAPSAIRNIMWPKFSELTKEARRLKQILDEQSVFASEQIEIAIDALEKELDRITSQKLDAVTVKVPKDSYTLRKNRAMYESLQTELSTFNVYASRINALRKELIKTEIRLKNKNKLFHRLSKCGDVVFPKRKELIKQISQQFIQDVEGFVNRKRGEKETAFTLKKEIKALQAFAKVLTLNTQAFSKTRTLLSQSWDLMKDLENKFKEEQAEKKEIFEKNLEELLVKIDQLSQYLSQESFSTSEGELKVKEIKKTMRQVELGREEVQTLKNKLNEAQNPLDKKIEEQEKRRQEEIERQKEQKQKIINQIETLIKDLQNEISSSSLEDLSAQRQKIEKLLEQSDISISHKKQYEEELDPLFDQIEKKIERELLDNSKDESDLIANKKVVLQKQLLRRSKIKEKLENYRKASGSSGLDFESSMRYNQLVQREKERLETIDTSIKELEHQI